MKQSRNVGSIIREELSVTSEDLVKVFEEVEKQVFYYEERLPDSRMVLKAVSSGIDVDVALSAYEKVINTQEVQDANSQYIIQGRKEALYAGALFEAVPEHQSVKYLGLESLEVINGAYFRNNLGDVAFVMPGGEETETENIGSIASSGDFEIISGEMTFEELVENHPEPYFVIPNHNIDVPVSKDIKLRNSVISMSGANKLKLDVDNFSHGGYESDDFVPPYHQGKEL